jgi:hypothetical protein
MSTTSIAWLLVALLLAGPTLVCLASRLVPLVMVVAVAAVVVRLVWARTR